VIPLLLSLSLLVLISGPASGDWEFEQASTLGLGKFTPGERLQRRSRTCACLRERMRGCGREKERGGGRGVGKLVEWQKVILQCRPATAPSYCVCRSLLPGAHLMTHHAVTRSLQLEFESRGRRASPQSRRPVGVDLAAMPAMVTRQLLPSSEGWPR
jgi:hypothetical protein